MLPIPSSSAIFAFVGSIAMLMLAWLLRSPTAAALGGGALLGIAGALALTMPLGARLRRQRLEFAWRLGHGDPGHGAGVVAGVPFEVSCYVRNRDTRPLRFTDLLPVVPNGVEIQSGRGCELVIPARTRSELAFRLSASAAGRVVLQGLAVAVPGPFGLFMCPLYFPSPLTIKVLPRAAAAVSSSARFASGEAVERSGLTPLRRRGSGVELHEIRELRPGDPFKSIAWKASARAGKLLVREVEHEVQDTLQIVLDVGGSMRGGRPGERKLDHCIELAALLAQQALARGDRVGLLTVDGRVLSEVSAAEGMRHMLRIYDALLKATEVVDGDLTQVDDETVTAMVGLYLRQQEGLELAQGGHWDLEAIATHAARALQAEPEHEQIVAGTPEHAALRRFCRVRGIVLPYRRETRGAIKIGGFADGLRKAAGATRTPRTLLLVSDLEGAESFEPLLQAMRLLKARHHNVAVIVPDGDSFLAAPRAALERDLRRVYQLDEQRRFERAQGVLGRLGVAILGFDGRRGAAAVARRADALRHVALVL
jgi:uncharacterized protein (DUF58 family)